MLEESCLGLERFLTCKMVYLNITLPTLVLTYNLVSLVCYFNDSII